MMFVAHLVAKTGLHAGAKVVEMIRLTLLRVAARK